MHVISKRSFLFIDFPKGAPVDATTRVKSLPRNVKVLASKDIQVAADWLRDLPAYQRAVKAKEIREVKYVAPEPEDEPTAEVVAEAKEEKAAESKGKAKAAK